MKGNMMNESRTQNSIRNVKTGAIVQLINRLMVFVVRTVFVKTLNVDYLGVNGLFTNILTLLSFAELGIGTAIIFNLYKPIAVNDKEKIKSLMLIYKKSYNAIGIIIMFLGICVIPFLPIIIKDTPDIRENLIFIYFLFLLNTSLSYFFTYKKSIIIAHQKQSVINNIDSFFYFLKSILEIIILTTTKNYILYLITSIIAVFVENIVLSIKADKMYPYLKEKDVSVLTKEERKSIFHDVKSLVVYKFGGIIMKGTDNILISSLINVTTVGLCSNYTMIVNAIKSIISTALSGITASVGNLNVAENAEKKENVFYQLMFVDYVVYSFSAIAFMVLLNPFIELWLGSEYVMSFYIPFVLAINFFVEGLRNSGYIFRTAFGLFQKGKITPYIGAISNIVFSIVFCKLLGIVGVFIGTIIAQLISYSWIDPFIIHRYEFKTSFKKYVKKYFGYSIMFFILVMIVNWIDCFIVLQNIYGFIIKCILVVVVPNLLNFIVFYKTDEFKSLKNKLLKI